PIGNQTVPIVKSTPTSNSSQTTTGGSAQETNSKNVEHCTKSSSISNSKGKQSTLIARHSTLPSATQTSKTPVPESITSCTVTLQPITNLKEELSNLASSRPIPTANIVQSVLPATASSVNLQQAIRSMLESKSTKPTGFTEPSRPHPSHSEPSKTLTGSSPPSIQSLVHIKSTSPATVTCVATISPSRSSSAKPSSVVQPISNVAPHPPLAQISNVLTHSGHSSVTTTTPSHSLVKPNDQTHMPSMISMANGSNTTSLLPGTQDQSRSTSIVVPDNSVRVTAVRRQTAPVVLNRASKPTQSIVSNVTASVIQRAEPQRTLVVPSTVTTTYEKQSRQQVVYQSAAVALSAAQIDQLQQRAVSSSVRSNPQNSCNSWLAATALLLQRPQPPPAHQQSNSTPYILSDPSKTTSTAHSGNQLTKSIPSSSPRTMNPTLTNPGP
ncbi:hypothetical protein FBUS_11246, partial [Fasciolopsis buskii]